MGQLDRHLEIAECIKSTLIASFTDPYMQSEVRIEDIDFENLPSYGIVISPESQVEKYGTNDRDDIQYNTLITRAVHALHNDDHSLRLRFVSDMRLLFHHKRLTCIPGCHLYCSVDFGSVAIPSEWTKKNNSVAIVRVKALVREHRTRD